MNTLAALKEIREILALIFDGPFVDRAKAHEAARVRLALVMAENLTAREFEEAHKLARALERISAALCVDERERIESSVLGWIGVTVSGLQSLDAQRALLGAEILEGLAHLLTDPRLRIRARELQQRVAESVGRA